MHFISIPQFKSEVQHCPCLSMKATPSWTDRGKPWARSVCSMPKRRQSRLSGTAGDAVRHCKGRCRPCRRMHHRLLVAGAARDRSGQGIRARAGLREDLEWREAAQHLAGAAIQAILTHLLRRDPGQAGALRKWRTSPRCRVHSSQCQSIRPCRADLRAQRSASYSWSPSQ